MIPRIIHYCWFGGNPLPPLALKCITSWQRFCPDYVIILWDENNFDINCNRYVKEAYAAGKWAFVSDVARLHALVTYGGFYMDTDCELLRPLDDFLALEAVGGFEDVELVSTALMGCRKGHALFDELLSDYNNRLFILSDGQYDTTTNVVTITDALVKKGLLLNGQKQTVAGLTVYPTEYFCPKNWKTGVLKLTEDTYTIHHFDGSWLTDEEKNVRGIITLYRKKYGNRAGVVLFVITAFLTFDKNKINYVIKKLKKRQ